MLLLADSGHEAPSVGARAHRALASLHAAGMRFQFCLRRSARMPRVNY